MSAALTDTNWSGIERAAAIILAMKDEAASEVLQHFGPDEVTQISIAMARLRHLSVASVETLVDRFVGSMTTPSVIPGGPEEAERLLRKVFPPEQVAAILADMSAATGVNVWRRLSKVDRTLLSAYVRGEHPQTAALILSQLRPELCARILKGFDRPTALDIIDRMLRLKAVQPEALTRVEEALRIEFLGGSEAQRDDKHARLAEVFNSFDSATEAELMDELVRLNPVAAGKVQNLMFTAKDLVKLEATAIQTIIQATDRELLSRALRSADETLRLLFFANMSARAVKRLEDEWVGAAAVPRQEAEAAQAGLLKVAKDLIARGEISGGRNTGDDD